MVAIVFYLLVVSIPLVIGHAKQPPARCPVGSPQVLCKTAPCAVNSCPRYPYAVCVNDYCGGCNARFYVNNKEVTEFCPSTSCPADRPQVICFAAPCSVNSCPRYPNAKCVDDYCGGCNAIFYINKTVVTDQCSSTSCPADRPQVICFAAPCSVNSCPRYPNAKCVNDYCGGCFARYYVNNTEVTQFCPSSPPICQDGSRPLQCFEQPCRIRTCQAYPNATCVDDFCGGCNARFFINKTEVTYDCCTSPPIKTCSDEETFKCLIDPCDPRIASCNVPTATCFGDICVGCNDRWFLPDCSEVTPQCNQTLT